MAEMLTKSFLMGLDRSTRKMEFAEPTAEEIETLPYAEAVEYLKKRDVLNKVDYDRLSAQLKFRAFTASRISDGALLKRINGELIKNIEDGNGLKDFLGMTKTDVLNKVGLGNAGGWYWETVYRTNVQTAYNAGRMMGYEQDKPLALELVVIDDARTTDYCRQYAGKGFVLPYDDPFWKTHIPPFHFNCRTTIRAIYDERELPESWSSKADIEAPAKGFGNNPVVDDSWWKELDSQVRQAKMYGVQGEIEAAKEILIDKGRKEDLIKEAAQQIEKINNDDIQLRNEVKELLSNKSYFKNQPDKLKEIRLKTIDSHNTEQLNILKKYLEEIKITDGASLPHSIFDGETISLKYFGDLYHEFGHFLDNVIVDGKRARDVIPNFLDTLKKDALEWINHNSPEKTVASLDKIPKDVRSLINDKIRPVFGKSDYFEAADLLDGLTGGKLGGMKVMDGGAHEKGYYDFNETVKHIEGEAIAIFTETWYTPRSGTSRGVLEVFPNAYNLWIDFLRSAMNAL